jgi:hypothetical protein
MLNVHHATRMAESLSSSITEKYLTPKRESHCVLSKFAECLERAKVRSGRNHPAVSKAKEKPPGHATTGGFRSRLPAGLGDGGKGVRLTCLRTWGGPESSQPLDALSLPRLDFGGGMVGMGWQISRSRPKARSATCDQAGSRTQHWLPCNPGPGDASQLQSRP